MRRIRYAGAKIPHPAQPETAIDGREHAVWRHAVRRREVALGSKQIALCLFRPMRGDEEGVGRAHRQAPAGRRVSVRDFEHGLVESRDVELVAAEHARLQRSIQARSQERLVQLLGIAAALVVFRPLLPQQRLERGGARDQFLGRKVGLRNGQESRTEPSFRN